MFAIRKKKNRLGNICGYLWVYATDYAHKYIRSDGTVTYAQFTSTDEAMIFPTYKEACEVFKGTGCSKEYYEVVAVMLVPFPSFRFYHEDMEFYADNQKYVEVMKDDPFKT